MKGQSFGLVFSCTERDESNLWSIFYICHVCIESSAMGAKPTLKPFSKKLVIDKTSYLWTLS